MTCYRRRENLPTNRTTGFARRSSSFKEKLIPQTTALNGSFQFQDMTATRPAPIASATSPPPRSPRSHFRNYEDPRLPRHTSTTFSGAPGPTRSREGGGWMSPRQPQLLPLLPRHPAHLVRIFESTRTPVSLDIHPPPSRERQGRRAPEKGVDGCLRVSPNCSRYFPATPLTSFAFSKVRGPPSPLTYIHHLLWSAKADDKIRW